jgi:hypothetical protein
MQAAMDRQTFLVNSSSKNLVIMMTAEPSKPISRTEKKIFILNRIDKKA